MSNKPFGNSLFSFTRSEVRGLILLLIIIIVLLIIRYRKFSVISEFEITSLPLLDSVSMPISNLPSVLNHKGGGVLKKTRNRSRIIDPNTASYHELRDIGIPTKAASNLLKYREKGGAFYAANDLLKIYGIEDTLLRLINQQLLFKEVETTEFIKNKEFVHTGKRVSLNLADSIELRGLPGIGSVLASRIIKYRNLLGGFYSEKQLREVYGINDSLEFSLEELVIIDTSAIKKIDINRASVEQLQKHPYINRYQAKAILSYRRISGSFTSPNQLLINYLVPEEVFLKVDPYLIVN